MRLDGSAPVSRECAHLADTAVAELLRLDIGDDGTTEDIAHALGIVRSVLDHGRRISRGRLYALTVRLWRAEAAEPTKEAIRNIIRDCAAKVRALDEPTGGNADPPRHPAPVMVPLPAAPKSNSPVPGLTSIHSVLPRGPYGDAEYPGNCSGFLIRDLLRYFHPRRVLDPMTGGGTCRDVCKELGIACRSGDLKTGRDACDPENYHDIGDYDFVWLHPPYWKMKNYNDDPRCLSNAPTLAAFRDRLRVLVRNCASVLRKDGTLAVLMGDWTCRGRFLPLTHHTLSACMDEGLEPIKEIIKFQHNTGSADKTYPFALIPTLHETCILLKHAAEPMD